MIKRSDITIIFGLMTAIISLGIVTLRDAWWIVRDIEK
jgi:hypothetical protein